MLDMGFLPPIRQIVRALPAKRQTLVVFRDACPQTSRRLTHEFQQVAENRADRPPGESRRNRDPDRL